MTVATMAKAADDTDRLRSELRLNPRAAEEVLGRALAFHQQARGGVAPVAELDRMRDEAVAAARSAATRLRDPQLTPAAREGVALESLRGAIEVAEVFEAFAELGQDDRRAVTALYTKEVADTPEARSVLQRHPILAAWLRRRDAARAEAADRQAAVLADQAAAAEVAAPAALLARLRDAGADLGIGRDGGSIVLLAGTLAAADKAMVVQLKPELLAVLRAEEEARTRETVIA